VSLRNAHERANAQTKLARLAKRREALRAEIGGDKELREMTMNSLQETILELREEIARYDARHAVPGEAART